MSQSFLLGNIVFTKWKFNVIIILYCKKEKESMGRKIRCYNAYFGDCYAITDDENKLIVDFGIHASSKILDGFDLDQQLDRISNDLIVNYDNSDILITHFHYDHICGFVRMCENGSGFNHFRRIHIPNIWGSPNIIATNLLESLIISFLYKNKRMVGYTAKNDISLLDFINYISKNGVRDVWNLKRGDIFFENKYRTLLPDDKILDKISEDYLNIRKKLIDIIHMLLGDDKNKGENDNGESNNDSIVGYLEELDKISENTSELLNNNIVTFDEETRESFDEIYREYKDFEKSFLEYLQSITDGKSGFDAFKDLFKNKLNSYGNKISIVFQNRLGEENLLFTGDSEKSDLLRIIKNPGTDIELKIKDNYKYLKLPHHGTKSHFVDFLSHSINAENVLIPNAKVSCGTWMIDKQYGPLGKMKICAASNNCDCIVSCREPDIICESEKNTIYPDLYLDI